MAKPPAHKLLYGAAALMVLGFLIHLFIDYCRYKESFTSAPFWIWAVVDALLWLIPALLAFLAGYISRKKLSKKENKP